MATYSEGERLAVLETRISSLDAAVRDLIAVSRRPSWAMASILGVQSSVIVGLAVALLS